VRTVLDEEVLRLPERFRLPVVLCYLQGKSNTEAAAELGCPKGTVDSRLSEARRRLRGRLLRRGLAPAAGAALERVLAETADAGELPGSVVRPVVRAVVAFVTHRSVVAEAVSVSATALAQEVLHTMFLTRLKWTAITLLALSLCGSGAGVATYEAFAGGRAPGPLAQDKAPPAEPAPRAIDANAATVAKAAPSSAREVRQLLGQPSGIDRPIENVSLRDVLEMISDKFDVTIRIDPAAFTRLSNLEKPPYEMYDQPVRLPVVRRMSVGEVLRDVLAQVRLPDVPAIGKVTFLVKGSHIVIVPAYMIPFPQALGGDEPQPFLNPEILEEQVQGEPVTVEFQDKPLAEALRELAETTGTNIVLDNRAKDQGQTPVTATLQNVRLFTALKVLADMAELRPVVVGNVYYVTNRENAERLHKMEWPQPAPAAPPVSPPAAPPSAPAKDS
jgi:hypothetical protein